jgi:hypothetical protein
MIGFATTATASGPRVRWSSGLPEAPRQPPTAYWGVALQLVPGEPAAGPWRSESLSTVITALTRRGPDWAVCGRPVVLAVDGRSNSGKTTLAARIGEAVSGSTIVHTGDIAWAHSRLGWADLLIEGLLVPVHQGRSVSYRPPGWAEHGREGSIGVHAGCPLLVVEGDGAGRHEVADLIDALVTWPRH